MSVFAVSDLHGQYDLYKQICEFAAPGDVFFCLGDCGDRGPQSWKTITEIYNNPQFIYLKGNHEDMLVRAMKGYRVKSLIDNGGLDTYNSVINLSEEEQQEWLKRLDRLPLQATYTRKDGRVAHLSHAGYNPEEEECFRDYLWDREHFLYSWKGKKNEFVIHGHTPIPHMLFAMDAVTKYSPNDVYMKAFWYANGHKCCIDSGAFATGQILLKNTTFLQMKDKEMIDNG